MNSMQHDLAGKKILVTGGTGFIGGRLVEKLVLECQADVRVLVANFARVPRIARFPIEMVKGDLTKPDEVAQAASGCEIVFHCAYGNKGNDQVRRMVNVEGTRHVLTAALQAGVKRVLYLSTVAVYGNTPAGDLDETAPRRYSGDIYSDSKLDAENLAFDYVQNQGLPVTIIQPTVVYGPFAPAWTINVLNTLKTKRAILIDGGNGLCNAVYIDDVINGILLAAVKEAAIGEAFLISGEQPVTWKNLYNRYADMLGISDFVTMTAAEAEAYYHATSQVKSRGVFKETLTILREERSIRKRIFRTPGITTVRRAIRSVLPDQVWGSLKQQVNSNGKTNSRRYVPDKGSTEIEKPVHPLSPEAIQLFKAKTEVRIDKAKRLLGYHPVFTFEAGMDLTEQWARWANLLTG